MRVKPRFGDILRMDDEFSLRRLLSKPRLPNGEALDDLNESRHEHHSNDGTDDGPEPPHKAAAWRAALLAWLEDRHEH